MDRRIRALLRAGDHVAALTELRRAADMRGFNDLVREVLDQEGSDRHAVLDQLSPSAPSDLDRQATLRWGDGFVGEGCWLPDEAALITVYSTRHAAGRDQLLRWQLDGAVDCLLEGGTYSSLTLSPDGTRLAFSDGSTWKCLTLSTGALLDGPQTDAVPRVWWRDSVLGTAPNSPRVWSWLPEEVKLQPVGETRARDAEWAPWTCVDHYRRRLTFYLPSPWRAAGGSPSPAGKGGKRWSRLAPAWGNRALVCDPQAKHVFLCDPKRTLASARLPSGVKPVETRACPSGRLLALRGEGGATVHLVDLSQDERYTFAPSEPARRLIWSPSGQALAVSCQKGSLAVLGAWGGDPALTSESAALVQKAEREQRRREAQQAKLAKLPASVELLAQLEELANQLRPYERMLVDDFGRAARTGSETPQQIERFAALVESLRSREAPE